jgi:hypothetical protein
MNFGPARVRLFHSSQFAGRSQRLLKIVATHRSDSLAAQSPGEKRYGCRTSLRETTTREGTVRLGTVLVMGMILCCCGGGSFHENKELSFGSAVKASLDQSWERAAEAAYGYLKTSSVDDQKHDRALLLLAQAAEELGLSYAASLWYLDIAQSRRNVELLDKAIAGLERIIMNGAHDEVTLVRGYLATSEITDLSPERSAFVNYIQGLFSIRNGSDTWADQRFAAISPSTPYYFRARYLLAVRELERHQWTKARQALFHLLKKRDLLPEDVRDEAELALARLAMEERLYPQAIKYYQQVKRLAPKRPELLLEMAWAHYYHGQSKRALGLLVALDAPVYRGLIAPERYLLEAFCLRQLCQFEPARTAAVRLRVSYQDALRDLRAGISPVESEALRVAARQRGRAQSVWQFSARLASEKRRLEHISVGKSLSTELRRMYRVGIEQATGRLEQALEEETAVLADELISAESGVRLILHELSVGLLRGRSRPAGIESKDESYTAGEQSQVSYHFVSEYWTDELDSLVVDIPDRCLE